VSEPASGPARATSPGAAAALLRDAVEAAVERALEGVRRVAVLTGGGVDSSALLAFAVARARRVGGSAFGVALDFDGPGDDRPHRRALAAHLDCEILCVRPEEAAHRFALIRSGVDAMPMTWPGGPMEIEMLARARAHGAECALMGVGADELLDGDPCVLGDLARQGDLVSALTAARRLEGFGDPGWPALAWVARPLLGSLVPRGLRGRRARASRLAVPDWAAPALREVARTSRDHAIERQLAPTETAAQRFERFDGSLAHEHLASLRHQEIMASGLLRRDPYLDPELARIVTALPPAWLMYGESRRGLFREAMRGLLPDSLRLRSDKAEFEPAFRRFLDASGGFAALRPLAKVSRLATLGLVERGPFATSFDRFTKNPDEGWGAFWSALAVEAFLVARDEVA
jgi:asparagine synthase (glutamine-hydrolysing)